MCKFHRTWHDILWDRYGPEITLMFQTTFRHHPDRIEILARLEKDELPPDEFQVFYDEAIALTDQYMKDKFHGLAS